MSTISNEQAVPARTSVPAEIMNELRMRILRADLKPGQRLPPERELAKQFGTNRTSLREALRSLEAQGLVVARQGDGVRVQDFRETGEMSLLPHFFREVEPLEKLRIVTDMMRVRDALVPHIVESIVRNASDEELSSLQALISHLIETHEHENDSSWVADLWDVELRCYHLMMEISKSTTFLWIYNSFEKVGRGFFEAQPQMWTGVMVNDYVDIWQNVSDALMQRDGKLAMKHYQRLVKAIEDQVSALLKMLGQ